jgi:hypothetical protein
MTELRVAAGMIRTFLRLPIALQAEVLIAQKLCHFLMTDRMLLPCQLSSQSPGTLADPTQRRFGIAASSEFLYPLAGAFSSGLDTYALSSILTDDTTFFRENPELHLRQADYYRIRYFVLETSRAKARMAQLSLGRAERHDFGVWTVFELKDRPAPDVQPLGVRPILVLTSFSAKARLQSNFNFFRLAEEEFLRTPSLPLTYAPAYRLDKLPDPAGFGALVVERYEYHDAGAAFGAVQVFSRQRPVVLIAADDPLFRSLSARRAELGAVRIVERAPSNGAERWIGVGRPVSYARNPVRLTWMIVRAALGEVLERGSVGLTVTCSVSRAPALQRITCEGGAGEGATNVAVASSFHPNWRAAGGAPVLMLSPSLTYTQVQGTAELRFRRNAVERGALWLSGFALAVVGALSMREKWLRSFRRRTS